MEMEELRDVKKYFYICSCGEQPFLHGLTTMAIPKVEIPTADRRLIAKAAEMVAKHQAREIVISRKMADYFPQRHWEEYDFPKASKVRLAIAPVSFLKNAMWSVCVDPGFSDAVVVGRTMAEKIVGKVTVSEILNGTFEGDVEVPIENFKAANIDFKDVAKSIIRLPGPAPHLLDAYILALGDVLSFEAVQHKNKDDQGGCGMRGILGIDMDDFKGTENRYARYVLTHDLEKRNLRIRKNT